MKELQGRKKQKAKAKTGRTEMGKRNDNKTEVNHKKTEV